MKNYAGISDADEAIAKELEEAGINIVELPEMCRADHPEMRTIIQGEFFGWHFIRQWYYWSCQGPGIEVAAAEKLHEEFGKEVRVAGHCGCPSPGKQFKGLACGSYHVDTQRGLNALVSTIRQLTSRY